MKKLACTFTLLLLLTPFIILTLNAQDEQIEDQLLRNEEEGHKCYEPVPKKGYCSVFPFKSSLGPEIEEASVDQAYYAFKAKIPNVNETHLYTLRAFSCYLSLGICNDKKWGIPRGPDLAQLKLMLKKEKFANLGNNEPQKPVLCKSTCNQAIDIFALQAPVRLYLGDDLYQTCSLLPDTNCIDAEKMAQHSENGSSTRSSVQSFVAFVAFLSVSFYFFGI